MKCISRKIFIASLLFLAISCKDLNKKDESTPGLPAPAQIGYTITSVHPHDTTAFTQGLEFAGGTLYESTGNPEKKSGGSWIGPVNLSNGIADKKTSLPPDFFGEGITFLYKNIYQLTWQNQRCFIYDAKTFEKKGEFRINGEGWGLTNDGKYLIMSNGSNQILYIHPDNFQTIKVLSVQDNTGMRNNLNELEFINGDLFANVWTTDQILKIDTATGNVKGILDLSALRNSYPEISRPPADVMNGIAWDSTGKKLFITGKYWPKMFELKLN